MDVGSQRPAGSGPRPYSEGSECGEKGSGLPALLGLEHSKEQSFPLEFVRLYVNGFRPLFHAEDRLQRQSPDITAPHF